MLTALFLTLVTFAGPGECDARFFDRVAPDAPAPPPPGPLLDFAWDTDDSGDLDATERAALMRDEAMRCEALDAIADQLDVDRNGLISPQERREGLHALFGPPPPPPPRLRPPPGTLPPPVRIAYDLDRNGILSATERAAARTDIQDRFRNGLPPVAHPEVR